MPTGKLPYSDENEIAAAIRKAIGADAYEEVEVTSPPRDRTDGKAVTVLPKGAKFLDALRDAPEEILKDVGLQRWGCDIWLFPKEWFNHIPHQYQVTDIFGRDEPFCKGTADDDTRYGALPFGIRHKHSSHQDDCECEEVE